MEFGVLAGGWFVTARRQDAADRGVCLPSKEQEIELMFAFGMTTDFDSDEEGGCGLVSSYFLCK